MRPDLGTVDDLRALTRRLRGDGHQPVPRPGAQPRRRASTSGRCEARAGERDVPRLLPGLPRPRRCPTRSSAPCRRSSRTSRRAASPGTTSSTGWVWTTFNDYQWDVNWANPDVLCEYADVILDLANHGVEVFRLDAIAFTWKRLGTNCQNQPEVHALTQALRTVARIACPAVVFKAEAIVGPQDLLAYLGQGEHHGKVSDLAYHNGLMVQIWSMLASQRRPARRPGPAAAAAGAVDDRLDHLRALPRRHRLGDLRRGRRGGRAVAASSTGGSSRTSTPASSPGRGPAAWCSRRTRPPATGGSPGRWPRWPGSRPATRWRRRPDPAGARDRARLRRRCR